MSRRGFTITVSIVLISITLISMALFSGQWAKSNQASAAALLPAGALRMQERLASDLSRLVNANASMGRQSSFAVFSLTGSFPFKKEGLPLFNSSEFSSMLPRVGQGSGFELIAAAENMSSGNATVVLFGNGGFVQYSNQPVRDAATIYHPQGQLPLGLNVSVYCREPAISMPNITASSASGSGAGFTYAVSYLEPNRTAYKTATVNKTHNISFEVNYYDGGSLAISSGFSPSYQRNFTSISLTKSPGAYLILPFDSNATLAWGSITDFSGSARHFTPGGGAAAAMPLWLPFCNFGGCYYFDATNDYMSGPVLNISESPADVELGNELVENGGFETVTGNPDDATDDEFANWTIFNAGDTIMDATRNSYSGDFALSALVKNPDPDLTYIYQSFSVQESLPLTLSFYSSGSEGQYSLYLPNSDQYLQEDMSWSVDPFQLMPENTELGNYAYNTRTFSLPSGQTSLQLRLYGNREGEYFYFDGISLIPAAGFNGGFEHYYSTNTE